MQLQQKIAAQKTALTQLTEALQLVISPPNVKVSTSDYPALDRVQALLDSARSSDEQKSMVANLKKEIAVEETLVAELEAQLNESVDQLAVKIPQAQAIAARINQFYGGYLEAIGELMTASQEMNELRSLVISPKAEPLRIGDLDRLSLSNAIGFAVDNGGKIVARLDHFTLGF